MNELIMKAFQLALEGSVVLLAVMLLRFLLNKAPKKYICFLWAVALLRLCMPVLPQGPIPAFWRSAETTQAVGSGQIDADLQAGQQNVAPGNTGLQVNAAGQDGFGNQQNNSQDNIGQMAADQMAEQADGMTTDPGQYWLNNTDYFAQDAENATDHSGEAIGNTGENADNSAQAEVGDMQAEGSLLSAETVPSENISQAGATTLSQLDADILAQADEKPLQTGSAQVAFDKLKIVLPTVLSLIWLAGAAIFTAYTIAKYTRIRRQLREALPEENFGKYPVKHFSMEGLPAVFGVSRPCIYVPEAYAQWTDSQKELILLHETTHIKRGDHILKVFSVLVLCLYWWNPLVWLSVKLLHSDIEMACDEGVLSALESDSREAYAKVLLFYAAKNSGIVLPAAFAESNTEGRIKNILRYKKAPVALTAVLILVVGIAVICIATKPKSVEQKTPDGMNHVESTVPEKNLDEELAIESDTQPDQQADLEQQFQTATWPEEARAYWRERLTAEGKVENLDKNLFFFDYWGDLTVEERGTCQQLQCLAVVLTDIGEVELYQTTAETVIKADGTLETSELQHRALETIDKRETLLQLPLLPYPQFINDVEGPEQVVTLISEMKSRLQTVAPESYARLQDPVLAAEELLPLQGGSAQFFRANDGGHLEYIFADGSSAYIYMYSLDGLWYPSFVEDIYWEQNADREERDRTWIENCKAIDAYMDTVTGAELRKITERCNGGISQDAWYEYDTRAVILDELKSADATLYGVYGGSHMMLRVKDKVIPLWVSWISPQMHMPSISCGDYDGDGQTEYAIKTHLKTGTGYSGDQLFIIELQGENYTVNEYYEDKRMEELAGINYDYKEQYGQVTVFEESGKEVSLYLNKLLEDCGQDGEPAKFEGLSFGDVESFLEVDGKWYYATEGGVVVDTLGPVTYAYGYRMICPVIYNEKSGFSLGEMQFAAYNDYEEMQAAINPQPEKVLQVFKADLTHDGKKEDIVVSVTCIDEESEKEQDFEKLLQRGELCRVRVYNVERGAYDENAWPETGGYCTAAARWSNQELSNAAEGTGMVYLVQRDGKDYLMCANAVMWQGVLEARYSVIQLTGEYAYAVDSAELQVDFNSDRAEEIEEALDVEAMVAFTEKWNAWAKDGRLLVRTAHEGSVCAKDGKERFDAWRIWDEIVGMAYEDASLFEGAPKQVALKDMHSLHDALTCMKESRVYWAHCIHGGAEDTGHQEAGHHDNGHHEESHH